MQQPPPHPATFSKAFIPIFASLLADCSNVLDPFAGIGKLALIKHYGFTGKVVCNEIEHEWAINSTYDVDEWHIGDAANMIWADDNTFDAICTSPTYGNRMADHHHSKDNSIRITYRHYLGRQLNTENTGRMQWGKNYCKKHAEIYKECLRVLKPQGKLIINISDHIRKGILVSVSEWHRQTLMDLGLTLIQETSIATRRMKFGNNRNQRVQKEIIFVFKK